MSDTPRIDAVLEWIIRLIDATQRTSVGLKTLMQEIIEGLGMEGKKLERELAEARHAATLASTLLQQTSEQLRQREEELAVVTAAKNKALEALKIAEGVIDLACDNGGHAGFLLSNVQKTIAERES